MNTNKILFLTALGSILLAVIIIPMIIFKPWIPIDPLYVSGKIFYLRITEPLILDQIVFSQTTESGNVKTYSIKPVNPNYKLAKIDVELTNHSESIVKTLIDEKAAEIITTKQGRFEPINTSIKKLRKEGIKEQVKRIPPKWFVEGDQAKYFYLCDNANKATSEEAADNALNALKNWNGIDNLKNINNETLIIWGDKDTAYNFDQVDALSKNIPNSKMEIFKGCSHNVHLELPEKFNEIVKNFIEN